MAGIADVRVADACAYSLRMQGRAVARLELLADLFAGE
jgi:hypothetical protein